MNHKSHWYCWVKKKLPQNVFVDVFDDDKISAYPENKTQYFQKNDRLEIVLSVKNVIVKWVFFLDKKKLSLFQFV